MKTETKVKLWIFALIFPAVSFYCDIEDKIHQKENEQQQWEKTYGKYEILNKKARTVISLDCPKKDPYNVVMPDTVEIDKEKYIVTEIGKSTFGRRVVSVILPKTTRRIHTSAFYKCYDIEKITIPDRCEYIDNRAFYDCPRISQVNISPESRLKVIGDSAFYDCTELKEITLPPDVKFYANSFPPFTAINYYPRPEPVQYVTNPNYRHDYGGGLLDWLLNGEAMMILLIVVIVWAGLAVLGGVLRLFGIGSSHSNTRKTYRRKKYHWGGREFDTWADMIQYRDSLGEWEK